MNPAIAYELPNAAPADLDPRIAAAFDAGTRSDAIPELIAEAEAAAVAAGEEAEHARTRALDPILSADAVAVARRQMEDARFRRERLETAVARLRERRQELRGQEEDDRRWMAYRKAEAERDALADELGRVYPPLAAQLADLFGRIAANDREVEQTNRALPKEGGRLREVELVARNLDGWVRNGIETPRIVKGLRLPAFETGLVHPYLWPPASRW
jgi:hypothetical protein